LRRLLRLRAARDLHHQRAPPEPARLVAHPRLHRLPERHPARPHAGGHGPALLLRRPHRAEPGGGGAGEGRHRHGLPPGGGAHRAAERGRAQRVHRGRHAPRRAGLEGAGGQHLHTRLADPRRRAHHPARAHHGGGLLPAPHHQPHRLEDARHPPPRRHRAHRGDRRGRDRRLRGGRHGVARARGQDHARRRRERAAHHAAASAGGLMRLRVLRPEPAGGSAGSTPGPERPTRPWGRWLRVPRRRDLRADMIRPPLPRRLKVVRIEPGRVKVRLERLVRRTLPVRPELAGLPPLGYTPEAGVTPGEVEVSGPASKVEDLKEIKTEPLELRSAPEAFSRTVLLSWAGDFVSFAPDHVTVSVAFQPTLMSRKFDHVEVAVRNLGGGLRAKLVPPRLDLTVQGPQRVLSNYALEAGSVYVDAAGLEPGTYRVTPKIELPQSIEVTRREPEVQTLELTTKGGR